jgi:hypothetical protein
VKKLFIICTTVLLASETLFAQDTAAIQKEVDPTKPTNLYTQVNTNLQYQSGKTQNLYGLSTNVQYAFNPDNLLLVEVPFLYNDRTSKFGLADMRVRYFSVVKRNISKSFIAIAPFADISLPTGSYKNGLGSSSWSLAGGVVFGFVASKKLALFPGISYVHITKPSTDLIPPALKFSTNGIGLQFNASYKFSKKTFMFINPTPAFLNTNGEWKSFWSGDLNLNRMIKPGKFKMNIGWSPNFTAKVHTLKLGATFFL